MMKPGILMIASAALLLTVSGCSNSVDSGGVAPVTGDWLIPVGEVFDGGPGRDGIPALTNPENVAIADATYLGDNDLVIVHRSGDEVRAYPHEILDWHEIINDGLGGQAIAITYCPLTGSAIGWDRVVGGATTSFGVSGLVYNTNLIPFDRATKSNWSQMRLQCVNGDLIGSVPEIHHVVETSFKTFREAWPEATVVSTRTGFSRPYGQYPYADYRTNHGFLLFPVAHEDNRLVRKVRVLGVIVGDNSLVYPINSFPDSTHLINQNFNGAMIVTVGSRTGNFAASFDRRMPDGTVLNFSPVQNALPVVMIDNEGTSWDLFGYGLSGPRAGSRLTPNLAYIAYWFAWAVFYPNASIHTF